MKGYIIYLSNSSHSVEVASETLSEIKPYFDVELFDGVDKYSVWQEFIDSDLKINDISRFGGGFYDSELGAFMSHYKLWNKCIESDENFMIFEHDAKIDPNSENLYLIHDYLNFDLVNLGKPNWGNRIWEGSGIVKREICNNNHNLHKPEQGECQCNSQWLFGAHSYIISPSGAKKLIESTKKHGILPADLFIRQEVITIHDLLPHPFTQKETFSLIQRNSIYKNQIINAWDD